MIQLNNTTAGKALYDRILMQAGFNIIGFCEHHFTPFGYTALWLLAESHFALHTFPEEQACYIELSSCSKPLYDTFLALIRKEVANYGKTKS